MIDPHLWDTRSPYLYTITSELIIDGVRMDSLTQNLGFRHIEFAADKGFFLNGKSVKIMVLVNTTFLDPWEQP